MKLSNNFTLEELVKSPTAKRLGFSEQFTPEATIISNLTYLSQKVLEAIRVNYGPFSVTSAYRCKRLNNNVGSTDKSFHLLGAAADINLGSKQKNKELFEFIKDNLEFTELINEYDFTWVHVAIVKGRENEKKIKIIK